MHFNNTLALLSLFALTALSHVIPSNDTSAAPLNPRGGTNVLNVVYRCGKINANNRRWRSWTFYTTTQGKSAACNKDPKHMEELGDYQWGITDRGCNDEDAAPPPWPNGDMAIKPYGGDCRYMNNNTNPGALWCKVGGEWVKTANCQREADADAWPQKRVECKKGHYELPTVYCEWPQ
jgi:hypothetical protein